MLNKIFLSKINNEICHLLKLNKSITADSAHLAATSTNYRVVRLQVLLLYLRPIFFLLLL